MNDCRPIDVLYVEAPPLAYGSSRSLFSLMSNLDRHRVRPVLACNRENELLRWAERSGIPAYPLSLPGLPRQNTAQAAKNDAQRGAARPPLSPTLKDRLLLPVRMMRDRLEFKSVRNEIHAVMEKHGTQILHLNNQISTNRFAYTLGTNAKIVQHVRDAPLSRSFHASILAQRADRLIAISRFVAQDVRLAYRKDASDIVANPIDAEFKFNADKRAQLRRAWAVPDDVLLFGQAGRFVEWKGVDLAIDAYVRLCDDPAFMRSTRLVLAGSSADRSEYFDQCRRRASDLPEGQIRIEPFSDDPAALFSAFDVTLHPIRKPEAFGRVIIESMACGSVPVARNRGAIEELISNRKDGIFFDDVDALGYWMRFVWDNPAQLEEMRTAGQETAKSYHADAIARRVELIYQDLVRA